MTPVQLAARTYADQLGRLPDVRRERRHGLVDVSNTLGGAVKYRINAAGCVRCRWSPRLDHVGDDVPICTLPRKACPAREWRGEAVFDALPGTLVIGSDGTTQIMQAAGATRATVRAATTYLPG